MINETKRAAHVLATLGALSDETAATADYVTGRSRIYAVGKADAYADAWRIVAHAYPAAFAEAAALKALGAPERLDGPRLPIVTLTLAEARTLADTLASIIDGETYTPDNLGVPLAVLYERLAYTLAIAAKGAA